MTITSTDSTYLLIYHPITTTKSYNQGKDSLLLQSEMILTSTPPCSTIRIKIQALYTRVLSLSSIMELLTSLKLSSSHRRANYMLNINLRVANGLPISI